MKTLEDLLKHQLKDLYNAESQLIKALPEMAENAQDEELKNALEDHLEETREHKRRLELVCGELNIDPSGEKCDAMEGLIREAEGFLKEKMDDEVRNAGVIAEAQRIEHYEISAYGTVVRYAKELGHHEIANTLQRTLDEEYEADKKLNALAENRLNLKAIS